MSPAAMPAEAVLCSPLEGPPRPLATVTIREPWCGYVQTVRDLPRSEAERLARRMRLSGREAEVTP